MQDPIPTPTAAQSFGPLQASDGVGGCPRSATKREYGVHTSMSTNPCRGSTPARAAGAAYVKGKVLFTRALRHILRAQHILRQSRKTTTDTTTSTHMPLSSTHMQGAPGITLGQ